MERDGARTGRRKWNARTEAMRVPREGLSKLGDEAS